MSITHRMRISLLAIFALLASVVMSVALTNQVQAVATSPFMNTSTVRMISDNQLQFDVSSNRNVVVLDFMFKDNTLSQKISKLYKTVEMKRRGATYYGSAILPAGTFSLQAKAYNIPATNSTPWTPVKIAPSLAPVAPKNVTVNTNWLDDSITVKWQQTPGVYYKVSYYDRYVHEAYEQPLRSSPTVVGNSYTFTRAILGDYKVVVRAYRNAKIFTSSPAVNFSSQAWFTPTVDFKTIKINVDTKNLTADISWKKPTTTAPAPLLYKVYIEGYGKGTVCLHQNNPNECPILTGTSTNVHVERFFSGHKYTVEVVAYYKVGAETMSEPIEISFPKPLTVK